MPTPNSNSNKDGFVGFSDRSPRCRGVCVCGGVWVCVGCTVENGGTSASCIHISIEAETATQAAEYVFTTPVVTCKHLRSASHQMYVLQYVYMYM